MKKELLELAKKNKVQIVKCEGEWWADIVDSKYTIKHYTKLQKLVDYLSKYKIKINN
jgi:hypothetical protein